MLLKNNIICASILLGCSQVSYALSSNSESSNIFKNYDNYIALDYQYAKVQDAASMSGIGISGEALLDNNLWLNGAAFGLLSYNADNSNRGLSILNNNTSGSSFTLRGGYSFNVARNFNFIPYLGFNYSNLLVAYNYNSTQQFIVENPSYSAMIGSMNEYNIIDNTLKFRLGTEISYSAHKAVLPNSLDSLGHIDFNNYVFSVTPEIQYNVTSRFTVMGYYSFATKFANDNSAENVYYPSLNVNSSAVINNDSTYNSVGIKLGVLF